MAGVTRRFPGGGLGARIFFATTLVVVAVLAGASFLTRQRAQRAADQSVNRALTSTQSAIEAALASRSDGLHVAVAHVLLDTHEDVLVAKLKDLAGAEFRFQVTADRTRQLGMGVAAKDPKVLVGGSFQLYAPFW